METIEQRKRRAISPVIATVILVAVAITVAVGVSYWMSGIAGQYTSFEKVEIQTGYATYDAGDGTTPAKWTITMALKNSGSADATINMVFLNDVPCISGTTTNYGKDDSWDPAGGWGVSIPEAGVTLKPGQSTTIYIYIENPITSVSELEFLSAGTTVNVKLHSAGAMDYIKLIRLP